jgi:hypothetical protein
MKLQNSGDEKLSRLLVLFALTASIAACGGGGGGDSAAPPPDTPAPPSPPPASDIITLADAVACPKSANLIETTEWSKSCFTGKRAVGKDLLNPAIACELKFLADGGYVLTHNGITYASTKTIEFGTYQNTFSGNTGYLLGSLKQLNPGAGQENISRVNIKIANNPALLADSVANQDTLEVDFEPTTKKINCKLDSI